MPRSRDDPPAVRVYTVCDESKCKPMDDEDCEQFTDIYWIKFCQVNNARFAKRKLDEFVFLGSAAGIVCASDTNEKLEGRKKEVLARLKSGRFNGSTVYSPGAFSKPLFLTTPSPTNFISQAVNFNQMNSGKFQHIPHRRESSSITTVSSDKDYFSSQSMNQMVQLVREKLDKIQSSAEHLEAGPSKKAQVDNRRRI